MVSGSTSQGAPTRPTDPIFIVGAPRSGTTWLAKIFDSHPDVLYRHEPDHDLPAPPADSDRETLLATVRAWRDDRHLRANTKRPFFTKSWRPGWAHALRGTLAYGMMAAGRLPGLHAAHRRWSLPDLGHPEQARLVIKTVNWCDGIAPIARALPGSRTVVIIRRPCGQVHSVLRGTDMGRFELREQHALPYNYPRARAYARAHGVPEANFDLLRPAARIAWDWAAFNETLVCSTAGLSNVMVVIYETLCEQPEAEARRILDFVGLSWHPRVAGFVRASTTTAGDGDYYGVVRNPVVAAHRWRGQMADDDRVAVQAVARQTRLTRYWPDLLSEQP